MMPSRIAWILLLSFYSLGLSLHGQEPEDSVGQVTPGESVNVLFITIDDLRPELASYKTDGIRTPHVDRLAAKGLQFNAAYCQYPVCNPSRSSFLTGLRPNQLEILSNKVALRQKWPDLVTLPQLFRKNG